jgi:Cu/Ag efflux protein CusF
MKKIFTIVTAVALAFPVAGFALAASHEKAAPAAAPAAGKAAPTGEKKAEKTAAKAQQVSGTIEAVDAAAGTLTVKGRKGNVDLKAGEKVKLGDVKVGDKVVVKYADGTASSVKVVKAPKAAPAAAPAPAAVPVKK